eukprot:COSAG01_NODE_55465_length_325_cov_0.362832_1_plen_25_part_01
MPEWQTRAGGPPPARAGEIYSYSGD